MGKCRVINILNGDRYEPFKIYYCAKCGKEVKESHPREVFGAEVYCGDCAFILGLITEGEYIKRHLMFLQINGLRVAARDGEIYVVAHGKFPWEKTPKEMRNSKEYMEWRKKVFERDGYRCAICGRVGGRLNAHHIKPYKSFESLRFDVDNGVTLCEKCHKSVHKDKSSEWLRE